MLDWVVFFLAACLCFLFYFAVFHDVSILVVCLPTLPATRALPPSLIRSRYHFSPLFIFILLVAYRIPLRHISLLWIHLIDIYHLLCIVFIFIPPTTAHIHHTSHIDILISPSVTLRAHAQNRPSTTPRRRDVQSVHLTHTHIGPHRHISPSYITYSLCSCRLYV